MLCFATAHFGGAIPLRIIAMPLPVISLRCIAPAMQVGGALCLCVSSPLGAVPPLYSSGLCPCVASLPLAFADQGVSLHIHSCDLRNFAVAGQLCAGPRRFVAVQNHAAAYRIEAMRGVSMPLRLDTKHFRRHSALRYAMPLPYHASPSRCRSVHYSSAPWRCRTVHYRAVPLLSHSVHIHSRALPHIALPRPLIALPCLCHS